MAELWLAYVFPTLVSALVNCQKPQNAQAYQAVYREWCKEFQDYKHMMVKYKQQLEDNVSISSASKHSIVSY